MNGTIQKKIELGFDIKNQSSFTTFKKNMEGLVKLAKDPSFKLVIEAMKEQNKLLEQQLKLKKDISAEDEKAKKKATEKDKKKSYSKSGITSLLGSELGGTINKLSNITGDFGPIGLIFTALKEIYNVFSSFSRDVLAINLSSKEVLKDIKKDMGSVLDLYKGAGTYSLSSSLTTNASARQLQLSYGLSDSESYAYTKAAGILGMSTSSLDDLMYANASQRELLSQLINKYSSWYDYVQSTGLFEELQTLQLEFSTFKQEMSMEFLSFIAANKDTIMEGVKGVLVIVEGIAKLVLFVEKIAIELTSAVTSPFASLYSSGLGNYTNNANKTTTINIQTSTESDRALGEELGRIVQEAIVGLGG